jgi:hypothetical protein
MRLGAFFQDPGPQDGAEDVPGGSDEKLASVQQLRGVAQRRNSRAVVTDEPDRNPALKAVSLVSGRQATWVRSAGLSSPALTSSRRRLNTPQN